MWTRDELKSNAKFVLKKNYFYVLGFYLVYLLLSGNFITIIQNINEQTHYFNEYSIRISFDTAFYINDFPIPYPWIYGFGLLAILLAVVSILFNIFISSPLEIGYQRFYLMNRDIMPSFKTLFFSFTNAEYLNIVKIQLLRNLKIILWSFLFVIPGIVKAYEYSMIPFLLAENPSLSSERAFALSREMTNGQKLNMWILKLSFIGWYLLGSLLIIGKVFVDVYLVATFTELYVISKNRIIDEGFSTYDELPGVLNDL